jgi:hypothetical protein
MNLPIFGKVTKSALSTSIHKPLTFKDAYQKREQALLLTVLIKKELYKKPTNAGTSAC